MLTALGLQEQEQNKAERLRCLCSFCGPQLFLALVGLLSLSLSLAHSTSGASDKGRGNLFYAPAHD